MTENAESRASSVPLADSTKDLVRRLVARYLLVFVAVASLIAVDQAIIQPLLMRLNVYAPVINMAGRQRMLSQKIVKAALAMQAVVAPNASRDELNGAVREWSLAHRALQQGAPELNIPRIRSPAIVEVWEQLQPHFAAMEKAAQQLAQGSRDVAGGSNSTSESTSDSTAALNVLLKNEAPFLAEMEQLVSLMEQEASAEIRRLRLLALAIAGAIVSLVLGLGWFVFRPATIAIRAQVVQLEDRVAQRTRELNETLESLRCEIDHRALVESRNRTLAAELAHADRVESMGRLAAGLAHELNQPFGAITNYAEACDATLEAPWTDQTQVLMQRYLRELRQASLRAGSIIRRVRNFVRPGIHNNAADVEMAELIAEVLDLCRPEIVRMEAELILELPDTKLTVNADAIQIQQVLINLIQNSLQAMSSAPLEQRRLTIRMTGNTNEVQVDVIDNGSGLLSTDSERLFEPFHTTKADGLGIGLSICRSIIQQHRGTIWAKSLRPAGAEFSFVLPLAVEDVSEPVR